jgi:hypothetical protein
MHPTGLDGFPRSEAVSGRFLESAQGVLFGVRGTDEERTNVLAMSRVMGADAVLGKPMVAGRLRAIIDRLIGPRYRDRVGSRTS